MSMGHDAVYVQEDRRGAQNDLSKALMKHAEVVGGDAVWLKKSQRATARLLAAAAAYSAVVAATTGEPDLFANLSKTTGLEESTISSLTAERNAIKDRVTGPIPIQKPAAENKAAVEALGEVDDLGPAGLRDHGIDRTLRGSLRDEFSLTDEGL